MKLASGFWPVATDGLARCPSYRLGGKQRETLRVCDAVVNSCGDGDETDVGVSDVFFRKWDLNLVPVV